METDSHLESFEETAHIVFTLKYWVCLNTVSYNLPVHSTAHYLSDLKCCVCVCLKKGFSFTPINLSSGNTQLNLRTLNQMYLCLILIFVMLHPDLLCTKMNPSAATWRQKQYGVCVCALPWDLNDQTQQQTSRELLFFTYYCMSHQAPCFPPSLCCWCVSVCNVTHCRI